MNIERLIRAIAGFFVLASVTLGLMHTKAWFYFAAFVGLNLFQSAFTNWCPMVSFLKLMGFKTCEEMASKSV